MQSENSQNLLNKMKEVKIVQSDTEANELLNQGWILLSTGSGQTQTNHHDFYPFFKFCLGRVE